MAIIINDATTVLVQRLGWQWRIKDGIVQTHAMTRLRVSDTLGDIMSEAARLGYGPEALLTQSGGGEDAPRYLSGWKTVTEEQFNAAISRLDN